MQSEIKDKISYPVFLEFSFVDRNILFELEFKSSKYNSWNLCDADNIYVTHVHCYAWFIYKRTGCKCIHLDICIFGLYCKHHTTTTLPMDDNKKTRRPKRKLASHFQWKFHSESSINWQNQPVIVYVFLFFFLALSLFLALFWVR